MYILLNILKRRTIFQAVSDTQSSNWPGGKISFSILELTFFQSPGGTWGLVDGGGRVWKLESAPCLQESDGTEPRRQRGGGPRLRVLGGSPGPRPGQAAISALCQEGPTAEGSAGPALGPYPSPPLHGPPAGGSDPLWPTAPERLR